MTDQINYGQRMHAAMRRLMADLLSEVGRDGLPGDHHFYITFDTTHPGVDMAASLFDRYPEEMTIVVQHWFENLVVMDDRFSITLNFGNEPEPMVIPLDAIKTFVDPSVEFGLRFEAAEEDEEEEAPEETAGSEPQKDAETEPKDAEIVSLDQFRKH